MRQILISKAGSPDVLVVKESPDQIPRNGELRIKVEAAAVNPADILGRMGRYKNAPAFPYVPGFEIAGTVDMVTQGVSGFREGDHVLAYVNNGGYSDTICVPYLQAFKRLDWMSAPDGAALPVDYLTAYVTLVIMGSLHTSDLVLIHGAADGIGIAALDICRLIGVKTFGIASSDKHDLLGDRGLDYPIDKRDRDYERVIREKTDGRGVDIVLSRLSRSYWKKNYRVLASTGKLIYLDSASLEDLKSRRITNYLRSIMAKHSYAPDGLSHDNKSVAGFNLENLWNQSELVQKWMQQIISWYDEALFRPLLDKTFSFSQVKDAHHYALKQESIGKILLTP